MISATIYHKKSPELSWDEARRCYLYITERVKITI
nr:MAG TPA: hypothetical protein [Caudoviricetes sp.]